MSDEAAAGQTQISRRSFLLAGAAGAAGVTLGLTSLSPLGEAGGAVAWAEPIRPAAGPPAYGDWREVYQERWRWDKVVKSTHFVNCWYQAHCCWNVYVKDGLVWREEQSATYPQVNPKLPDFNPRGCQKGGCYSERMYDAARVKHPLKRVGERGSGKWQRISWDQALDEIADNMIDTIIEDGSERIIWEIGPLYTEGTMSAANQRLIILLDSVGLDMNGEIGDGHRGTAETFGKICFERSGDDYFYSDLILVWGGNPLYTQIPNAHFLTEARYNGAKIVTISTDYSASSVHADSYIPVKPGGDAALGLGVAQVLIEEDLIDHDFLVEQTDLVMLVREDDGRFLRGSDLGWMGSDEQLYFWDAEQGAVGAPTRSLDLDGLRPVLDGRFEVEIGGRKVGVRTVFSLLKEHLADYTPEKASAMCGTPPAAIRSLARRLAGARAASMVTTSNFSKYYHGNLIERAQALVFALTGNYGKKGSGYVGFPWLDHDGFEGHIRSMFSAVDMMNPVALKMIGGMVANTAYWKLAGYTDEMISYEHSRETLVRGTMTSGSLFWYVHGGLLEASEKLQEWDPYLKRPVREVLEESFEKGWQTLWPKPGDDPKMLFVLGGNPLRRVRGYPYILKHLWPKLRNVVTLDWRMSSTAMFSDYVLPAAGWYEHDEIKWATPLSPFMHAGEKATDFFEAKSDWEIISRLCMAVDRRARERGIATFKDRAGNERSFVGLHEKFSQGGTMGPTDDAAVCASLIDHSTNLGDLTWEKLKKDGFFRYTDIGKGQTTVGNATHIPPDDSITPLTKHVFDKEPYPTLSRRIQFYLDQELYREMGEQLPVHKDPPLAGGDYPLTLTGGHARWSIHANWRDDALMQRLQRGEPVMYLNADDARARGLVDGNKVRVFNDLDEFEIMAKVSPSVRKGSVIVYHAWENFQFKNGKGFQNLTPSPLNPVELAGGQYHLRPMMLCLQPSHTDRDTRVDVAAA